MASVTALENRLKRLESIARVEAEPLEGMKITDDTPAQEAIDIYRRFCRGEITVTTGK